MMRKLGCILIVLGWGLTPLAAMEIQTKVDRNPVALQQSFILSFSADQDPDDDPDFSPLRQQFEILNQQRSSQSSWVNGKSQHIQEWHISLMAKQAGEVLIPPIAFGKDMSKPLKIKVNERIPALESSGDLLLEAELNTPKVYQQAQLILSLRFYRRVQMTQAKLSEPELANVMIERLGEDASYSTRINGVEYAVTERKYALFPQQAGELKIPPISIEAEILNYQAGRQGFWGQAVTETRRIQSKPINVQVLPIAAGFDASNWLAAEALQLTEQWSEQSMQVQAGQPITRTLKLTARGTTVAQLPELATLAVPAGLKTYPDQPQLHEEKGSDGLQASREEKIAFIATQAGEYSFPELAVTWFNTQTGQKQIARLPATKIQVLPAIVATSPSSASKAEPIATQSAHQDNALVLWQTVSALLAIGWLLTIVYFIRRSPKAVAVPVVEPAYPSSNHQYRQILQNACHSAQPEQARTALLGYFAADNLAQIVDQYPLLAGAVRELSQALYAPSPIAWQGELLWQAFLHYEHSPVNSKTVKQTETLEPFFRLVS
jgi:hypothetical protein